MTELLWIVLSGLTMSAIALVGSVSILLSEATLRRLLPPVVAFAAGSLTGGAIFHLMPSGVEGMGATLAPWLWFAAGFVSFFALEQVLHWHHCHRPTSEHHRPLGWLVLVADAVHNFVGGVAVGGSFLVDIRLGIAAWLAAAAHEVPQELGDFGILVHSGWKPLAALHLNLLSALTFPLGGVLVWAVAHRFDPIFLLPFAAGNFLYIGAVDLVPELGRGDNLARNLAHVAWFTAGLALLLMLRLVLS